MKINIYCSDSLVNEINDAADLMFYFCETDDMMNEYYYSPAEGEKYESIESWNFVGVYDDCKCTLYKEAIL